MTTTHRLLILSCCALLAGTVSLAIWPMYTDANYYWLVSAFIAQATACLAMVTIGVVADIRSTRRMLTRAGVAA